ncbi:MAG: YncE family protein [Acidobacteriaceae bacterium]
MRSLVRTAAALITLTLASTLLAQTTLLALSKRDHTLSVIDPTTLHVLYTLPVGPDPHEVIASTDGTRAYASNYGFGAYHTLAVLDLVHHRALPSIDLGPLTGPHGLTFVGNKLYFTAEGAKAIGRFNPATQTVDWIMGTGQNRTHMIYVAPDLEHIITSNVASGTLSLIDLQLTHMGPPPGMHMGPPNIQHTPNMHPPAGAPPGPPPAHKDWNETVIPVGNGSEGFDLSPDHKEIWVANAQDGTISIIDYAAKKVVATLHPNTESANRLKFTPDGAHVLVSLLGNPDLVILDAHTRKVIKRLPIGTGAAGILMDPTGNRAFVACTPDNDIAIINLQTLTLTARIPNIPEPDGMAWATTP